MLSTEHSLHSHPIKCTQHSEHVFVGNYIASLIMRFTSRAQMENDVNKGGKDYGRERMEEGRKDEKKWNLLLTILILLSKL